MSYTVMPFEKFQQLPREEQRTHFIELRQNVSNQVIQNEWGLSIAKFYNLIKELNIPRIQPSGRPPGSKKKKEDTLAKKPQHVRAGDPKDLVVQTTSQTASAISQVTTDTHVTNTDNPQDVEFKEAVETVATVVDTDKGFTSPLLGEAELPYSFVLHLNGTYEGRTLLNKLTRMMAAVDDTSTFAVNISIVEKNNSK